MKIDIHELNLTLFGHEKKRVTRKKRIAELKQYQLRLLKNVKILIERVFTLEQVPEALQH